MIHTKCACTRVRRAARSLTDLYDEVLRPVGLKVTQFSALRTVDRLGPVNISTLAAEMALDRSTLGRNLGVLERQGLVGLSEGDDQRERTVTLTSRARRLLDRAVPLWAQAQGRVDDLLGKQGVATLFALLGKFERLR
ncbi:MAG TPA: MarR family winged helix-turn-helix transcriptional regulator [Casimicrobiaceae bacterium]|nr:MarR family winged helix-turn-helix transcriptional regulator [Casimicrobiaceae bacterium]